MDPETEPHDFSGFLETLQSVGTLGGGSQELIADVARCNSPLAWAKRQSSFEELKDIFVNKVNNSEDFWIFDEKFNLILIELKIKAEPNKKKKK